jgi:hypothetical protein
MVGMWHHAPTTEKQFLGRKLTSIVRISDSAVEFTFDDGCKSSLSVEGDCCSSSIFYAFDFPASCRGAEITGIEERLSGDSEEIAVQLLREHYPDFYLECLSIWDVVIHTTGGDIRIKHINSSNGYYDGGTCWSAPAKVNSDGRSGLTILN